MKITERQLRRIIKEEIERAYLMELSLPFFGWKKKGDQKAGEKDKPQEKSKIDNLKAATSLQGGLDVIAKIGQENPDIEQELTVIAKNFKKDLSDAAQDAAQTVGSLLKQPTASKKKTK